MVITLPKTYIRKIGNIKRGLFELELKKKLILRLFPVVEEGAELISKEHISFDDLSSDIVDIIKKGRKEYTNGKTKPYLEFRKELGLE